MSFLSKITRHYLRGDAKITPLTAYEPGLSLADKFDKLSGEARLLGAEYDERFSDLRRDRIPAKIILKQRVANDVCGILQALKQEEGVTAILKTKMRLKKFISRLSADEVISGQFSHRQADDVKQGEPLTFMRRAPTKKVLKGRIGSLLHVARGLLN